ncbi:MAG TPA: efflux RND transporter periplasmic adaptor subunit [Chryseolinea sp.]|nr:efflux RND transporter periplasmic adaptor subunit [Chryseolinea sp.]HPM32570.1 efflux RND transporter periplasmic adaptor subunit [Chryseolinea sp.]
MKSTLYNYLSILTIAAILVACDTDKSAKLEKLKAKQTELAKEIAALEKEMPVDSSKIKVKSKEVAVIQLAPQKFDHYVQTQGAIEAEDNILVSAKTPGVVTQVFVKEGQAVSKGQVLAQIDNSIILRGIEGMKSQLELANTVYNRQKNLWDQKIGTEVQYLQAKSTKESLDRQLAGLQEQNENTRIKSPISGTIDAVTAKNGESISPGMPAFRVINTSDLKITAHISEAYANTIKKGDKVVVLVDDAGKEIKASVTFVGKNIDLLTRTFPIEVDLPSLAELRPNMTAVIKVIFLTDPSAIVVPVNIVQSVNGEKIVYVSGQDGKNTVARKRVVEIAGVFDNLAQIKSGVAAGEKVITVGYQGLNDGDFIKL